MHILITGADHPVARAVVAALSSSHMLRAVDVRLNAPYPAGVEVRQGDLRDESFIASILDGAEMVLHLAPLSLPFEDEGENLDHAVRGTYLLLKAALEKGITRATIASSLGLFNALPASFDVRPSWRPHPQATVADLCAWLCECLARERARDSGARFTCLRLANTLNDGDIEAVVAEVNNPVEKGWRAVHVGKRAPVPLSPMKGEGAGMKGHHPIRNVVIFGAGGPLASAAARELQSHYALRLTDVRPVDELLAMPPQSPNAPVPEVFGAPHEWQVVDVTDADQVMRACESMDAIVNCTVIRRETVGAFRVNALGAYNIMRASVARGIRRIVHTGPYLIGREGATGYEWDTFIVDDVPPRPGGYWDLYFHTKLCGQEICRIFAEQHDLEAPALLFRNFVNPARDAPQPDIPFFVSWADAARAIRCALEIPTLPSPYEVVHVNGDLPHGVFPNDKAKRVLNWQPQDDLSKFWMNES
jgi:nucleoside-diphosphate-sugar epimerase